MAQKLSQKLACFQAVIQLAKLCDRTLIHPIKAKPAIALLGSVDLSAKFNQQGCEINKAQKILGGLLEARKDPAKVLELVEPALNYSYCQFS
ncbi:MAG: hypothetical protein KME13_17220 [Myxacorys californica WJT36-NPBG1]|nr:hypothetical protein [Myxacorys californica WJT36-NPBG1]